MSSTVAEAAQPSSHDSTEALSEHQIEQLLQEAETRLRKKAGLGPKHAEGDSALALALAQSQDASATKIHKLKLQRGLDRSSYIKDQNGVAKANSRLLVGTTQQKMANELRPVNPLKDSHKVNDQSTSGPQWFDLPKTELTPQLKRDLQLIEMRSVLDPHRHYKKNTRQGKVPTFSQVGTVVEGPTEWYSSRINKKDRSKNFVDEAMRTEQDNGRFKRKYGEIQDAKTSGKKAHYKKLLEKRRKKT